MHIKRLLVRGFGRLVNRTIDLPEGKVALISRPNESGKTAFLEAIIASLYGLPEKERASKTRVPLRNVYEPWDSDEFGLEVDVNVSGSDIRLIRDFAGRKFQVMELTNGQDVTSSTNGESAKKWLGIGSDDFRRLSCISGKETLQITDSQGVRGRLEELLSGSELTAEAASRLIEQSTQRYRDPNGNVVLLATAIARSQTALDEANAKRSELCEQQEHKAVEITELEEVERRIAELHVQEAEASAEASRLRLSEIRERLAKHHLAERESSGLRAEADAIQGLQDFPLYKQDTLTRLAVSIQTAAPMLSERDAAKRELQSQLEDLQAQVDAVGGLAKMSPQEADMLRDSSTVLRELERDFKAGRGQQESLSRLLEQNGIDEGTADRLYKCFDEARYEDQLAVTTWIERTRTYETDRERFHQMEAQSNSAKEGLEKRRATHQRNCIGLGFLTVVAALFGGTTLFAGISLVSWICFGGAGALFVLWLWQANKAAGRRAEIASVDKTLGDIILEYKNRASELENLRKSADLAAANLGVGSGRQAAEDWLLYVANRHLVREWARVKESIEAVGARLESAQFKAMSLAQQCGQPLSAAESNSSEIQRLALSAVQIQDIVRQRDSAKAKLDTHSKELDRQRTTLHEQKNEVLDILVEANIPAEGGLDEALVRFVEQADKARRYKFLTTELLPAREVGLLEDSEVQTLSNEEQELASRLAGVSEVPSSRLGGGEARAQLEEIQSQLKFVEARAAELNAGLWDTLNRIRHDLPAVETEIEKLTDYLTRAHRFQRASGIARDVLGEVGENARKQWAVWLNSAANHLLKELDVRWSDVVFGEDLSFTVRDAVSGRWLDMLEASAHLSSGAKDQVWFAARTGICQALSQAEPLPILLDDPFLTWDDERFRKGMRLLAGQVGTANQVILVTCHEDRHKMIQHDDPEWFDERFQLVEI